ncbi:MAG: DUF6090 family protein [Verrucomicrobia bacterium]|nr:DUF6090 family protein [Verrucomicrobiota bacterium]
MFRFFRTTRQQLLNENKTVKYLKYAVGEVLLIVAGILVALQINNWNEGRKLEQDRRELIEDLKVDYQTNLELWESVKNDTEIQLDVFNQLLKVTASENQELSVLEIKGLAENTQKYYGFQPSLGVYESAKSTDSIGLIEDDSLKGLFVRFQTTHWLLNNLYVQQGTDFWTGSALRMREKLGSIHVLFDREDFRPERFELSVEEYRKFIAQKDVYAFWENRQRQVIYQLRLYEVMKETTEQILATLEAL